MRMRKLGETAEFVEIRRADRPFHADAREVVDDDAGLRVGRAHAVDCGQRLRIGQQADRVA